MKSTSIRLPEELQEEIEEYLEEDRDTTFSEFLRDAVHLKLEMERSTTFLVCDDGEMTWGVMEADSGLDAVKRAKSNGYNPYYVAPLEALSRVMHHLGTKKYSVVQVHRENRDEYQEVDTSIKRDPEQ